MLSQASVFQAIMELRRLNSVQGIPEGAWGLKNLVALLLFSFSLILSFFLLSHIPLKFISLSKPLHAQNIEFEKSVDKQWIVSAVCLIPQWNVESSCFPVLSSGPLLHVVWWQKFDLSGFFSFYLCQHSRSLPLITHNTEWNMYARTHRSFLPVFQNWSPLAVDSCPVPNQPPFPPTTKQQVQSSGSTSEGCDTAGA